MFYVIFKLSAQVKFTILDENSDSLKKYYKSSDLCTIFDYFKMENSLFDFVSMTVLCCLLFDWNYCKLEVCTFYVEILCISDF